MGITLIEVPATSAEDIQADLKAREESNDIGIDAMMGIVEPLLTTPEVIAVMSKFATEHKILIGGPPISEGKSGSIFMTTPDSIEVGKIVAILADKILKGVPAGTIPVVTPEVHLQINYKVAKELGLTVPEGLLSRADEIIR
jgi:putative ABC transport system substrate-binding protein